MYFKDVYGFSVDICLGSVIYCQPVRHFPCGHPISDTGEVVPTHCLWGVTECEGCGVGEGWDVDWRV